MSLKRSAVLPAMLLIALLSGVAHAQSVGTISGTVTDSTGAIVPGVNVTIKSQGTGVERTVTTSGEGHYTAAILPIGTYTSLPSPAPCQSSGLCCCRPLRCSTTRRMLAGVEE